MDFLGTICFLFMAAASLGARVPANIQVPFTNPSDLCPSTIQLPSVTERLDKSNSGLERLVIFAYRKIGTSELITFIPSGEFQNCIQDYPETSGDQIYNTKTITIEALYEISNNKVIRFNKEPGDNTPNDGDGNDNNERPWDVIECPNCGYNLENSLDSSKLISSIDQQVTFPLPDSEQQNGSKEMFIISDLDKDKTSFDNIVFDWNTQHSTDSQHLVPEEGSSPDILSPIYTPQQSGNSETELVINVDDVPEKVNDKYPEIPILNQLDENLQTQDKVNKPPIISQEDLTVEDTFYPPRESIEHAPLYEQQQVPEQSMFYPPVEPWVEYESEDTTSTDNISEHNFIVPPNLYQNVPNSGINRPFYEPRHVQILPSISSPVDDFSLGSPNLPPQWQLLNVPVTDSTRNQPNKYGWTFKFPNLNFPVNHGTHKNYFWPIQVPSKPTNLQNTSHNFDSWLLAQLKLLKIHGNQMPAGPVDIDIVRKEIEETLRVNGFRVTGEGLLVDKNGVISSLSNLKLRPLFIGKSFPYNSLLTGAHADGKYKRPATPLIEGLLLTLINPAKVLGMVTLGVTALPHNVHVDRKKNYHLIREWNYQNYHKGLPKIQDMLPNFILPSHLRNGASGSRGAFVAATSLVFPDVNGSEDSNAEAGPEDLGFRIIGGSSATGTGTPLASKGRSGLEE